AFVTTNGLSMRDEIRRERRVELALEGFRYWDLIRWKTAEIELPKPILGSYYYSDFTARTNLTPINENGYLKVFTVIRKFDPARDYLFPFPTIELGLNQQLKQNPGWQ
ncbi:RagB/SusD family nutrient uptake outer membrane protein, partial [Flavobacterium sp.]|uniref:RagB/SusD family nutrient uptake outer membrane protein n=1 Tax=Flavobacterium sp. TaxID=239 RepID=UPI0038FC73AE